MQVFGNIATSPEKKESRATGKAYWQMRLCEAQRGVDKDPTFYTVRIMKGEDPGLAVGAFVRVSGKLRVDHYLGRDGKPTGTLLIIAFEATKIAKPTAATTEVVNKADESTKAGDTSAAAAIPLAVSLPMGTTAALSPLPQTVQSVPLSQEAQPVPAKPQMAPMRTLAAFALPSPVASPWGLSFGAPVPVK